MSSDAETCLATYGTLGPGRPNHHQLRGLRGAWGTGNVRGRLLQQGWGAAQGYPGIILDPDGDMVEVALFRSDDLPAHWPRLDAFEGDGYRRVTTEVSTTDGPVRACIYVLASSAVDAS